MNLSAKSQVSCITQPWNNISFSGKFIINLERLLTSYSLFHSSTRRAVIFVHESYGVKLFCKPRVVCNVVLMREKHLLHAAHHLLHLRLALVRRPGLHAHRHQLRRGEQGTVVLRVRVDERGAPVEVTIERSSGYRDLDRAARDTVADRWRFHPAQRDGPPVPAWGLVPVRFTLP